MSLGDTCLLPRRRPAWRWREPGSGSCAERGNLCANTVARTETAPDGHERETPKQQEL